MSTRGHHGLLLASAAVPSGYLDSLSPAPGDVFSLRKLISSATLSVRVRRSSDNAEQDIGFSGNAFDTTALSAFVGSNSAYVTTFYNQAGGNHMVQATTSKQPRIMNAGAFDGRLTFDGSDDSMAVSSINQGTAYQGLYAKLKQANSASYKVMFETGTDGQTTAGAFSLYVYLDNARFAMVMGSAGGGKSTFFNMTTMTVLDQLTALYDRSLTGTNETKLWRAGSPLTPIPNATAEQSGTFTATPLYVGGRTGNSLHADMWLETAVFYNADSSGIRASIEAIVS